LRPIASVSTHIVVRAGRISRASATSSKPVIDSSDGTAMPIACASSSAPSASASLPQITAVGRVGPLSAMARRLARPNAMVAGPRADGLAAPRGASGQRLVNATQARLHAVVVRGRLHDDREIAMAEVEQMRGEPSEGRAVVEADAAMRTVVAVGVGDDIGHPMQVEQFEDFRRIGFTDQRHRFDAARQHRAPARAPAPDRNSSSPGTA
jgi:hypothetical protein